MPIEHLTDQADKIKDTYLTKRSRNATSDTGGPAKQKRTSHVEKLAGGELPASVKLDPDRLQVWERRLLSPHTAGLVNIPLQEDGWTLRWFNAKKEGRMFQALYQLGWETVKKDDLAKPLNELGLTCSPEGCEAATVATPHTRATERSFGRIPLVAHFGSDENAYQQAVRGGHARPDAGLLLARCRRRQRRSRRPGARTAGAARGPRSAPAAPSSCPGSG